MPKKPPAMPSLDDAYRARDDADTLRRAGEIMNDSGRMKAAHAEVKNHAAALQKITQIASPRAPKAPRAIPGASPGFAKGKR